jgi:hypothetical protein
MVAQVKTAQDWYTAARALDKDAETEERQRNFKLAGFYRTKAAQAREKAAQIERGGE